LKLLVVCSPDLPLHKILFRQLQSTVKALPELSSDWNAGVDSLQERAVKPFVIGEGGRHTLKISASSRQSFVVIHAHCAGH
jgi:hypothetical protein